MKSSKKLGFTLVELIVVITILAILGTIAFISFNGYTRSARDGVRTSDITNLTKTMELYISEKGNYPVPSNPTNVLYSGATVWIQGNIGDSIISNLQTVSKKPIDPIFSNEYTYSINKFKNEFQIGSILEGEGVASSFPINSTYATLEIPIAYIKGTYNGKICIANTGGIDYVFALPSIISNDLSSNELIDIVTNKNLIYNNFVGYPSTYSGFINDQQNDFSYLSNTGYLLTFSGVLSKDLFGEGIFKLVDNLYEAYSGSIINDYRVEPGKEKTDLALYTWETVRKIYGLPKLNTLKSCEDVLKSGKSTGDGYYHFFASNNSSIYETYCDMSNGGRSLLFSVNPSGNTWKFDSQQWTKPIATPFMSSLDILTDEMTSGAYGDFSNKEVKVCRGNFTNCYIFKHNQGRTLKSFYNIGDSFLAYTRCNPGTRCSASPFPTDIGDIEEKNKFLALTTPPGASGQPKIGLGINVSAENRLGIQFDYNNIRPYFDNGGFGIGVFRSRDCGHYNGFVDKTRARSVAILTSCAWQTPDTKMWYVFAK